MGQMDNDNARGSIDAHSASTLASSDQVTPSSKYTLDGTQQLEMEMQLRRTIQDEGELKHAKDSGNSKSEESPVVELKLGDGTRRYSGQEARTIDLGKGPEDVIFIDWAEGDPENPFNYTLLRKSIILCTACMITLLSGINCTSAAIISHWGTDYFGVTRTEFLASNSGLMITMALSPMLLAPFSEMMGRNVIYQVTSVITALLFLPQAIPRSFPALVVARLFQGMSSSVGNGMVGGTVADLFRAEQRGLAMNVFVVLNFLGGALGSIVTGWVGMRGGARWAYGYQGILGAGSILLNLCFLRETREDVLLSRRAKRLTKQTGQRHVCASDLQNKSFSATLRVSLVRPFVYLATEPIVTALAAWIGFAWSCVFLSASSTLLVFARYGWNIGQLGSIQTCLALGAIFGFATSFHQERLYAKRAKKSPSGRAPPEARLYYAAFVGLAFPLGLFGFAWTGRPEVHWIVPAVFLVISNCGIYHMYVGVFNYLADAYETYSSSAQAAQSCVRNIGAAVIPLFAKQMYDRLGYSKATSLVACVAMALQLAPILLIKYGRTLRARSRVASALEEERVEDL